MSLHRLWRCRDRRHRRRVPLSYNTLRANIKVSYSSSFCPLLSAVRQDSKHRGSKNSHHQCHPNHGHILTGVGGLAGIIRTRGFIGIIGRIGAGNNITLFPIQLTLSGIEDEVAHLIGGDDDITVLDFIKFAVRYFMSKQQYYEWR